MILTSLRAEGTPRLVLDLARIWRQQGIVVSVVVLFTAPDELAAEFAAEKIPVRVLDWPRTGRLRYLRLATTIWRLSRSERPDAVLSMPFGWHAFMAWGARVAGVKRFVVHVGNAPTPERRRLFDKFRVLVQLGRLATTRHVCCSAYVRDVVIERLGLIPRETAVVHNGVSVGRFEDTSNRASDGAWKNRGCWRIGMVATLELHKDQPTLIEAGRLLRDRGVKATFILVGDGSRRPELESLAEALDLGDIVEFLGTRRDIPELLRSFDLFAFATTADEGQGIALIEAMAAGVPIVASDVGACREVLDGGACGVLVEAGDPGAMADGIQFVLANPEKREDMAVAALERVEQLFTIEHIARAYLDILGIDAPLTA